MPALAAQSIRSVAVWLSAFFSPSLYFVMVVLAGRSEIAGHFKSLILLLFLVIPPVALLVCETVLWRSGMTVAWKIVWMLFTLVAMLLQIGVLLVIIRAILIALTGYAQ